MFKFKANCIDKSLTLSACLALLALTPMPTIAKINVADDLHREYDACIAKFRAAGLGANIDKLDKSKNVVNVKSQEDHKKHSNCKADDYEKASNGVGSGSTLYWDAAPTYKFEDGLPEEKCSTLYHEIYHCLEHDRGDQAMQEFGGIWIPAPCKWTGYPGHGDPIDITEINATREENIYRTSQRLLKRIQYGKTPLPPDDVKCERPPPRPKETSRGCGGGCNTAGCSNGDVHLTTHDNRTYDFHSVGEFVLTQSKRSSDFVIQTRQALMPDTTDVSVNTAIAMHVGSDKVAVYVHEPKPKITVNGKLYDLPAKITSLPGKGQIELTDTNEIHVVWPDTSEAFIYQIGRYGLKVRINVPQQSKGQLIGLLGDFDGRADNDLLLRDGSTLKQATHKSIHTSFADSWRIKQEESLFDYLKGQSTKTFTDKRYPRKQVNVASLPQHAEARRQCGQRGITSPRLLEECIFDVAVTGQIDFADSSAHTEKILLRQNLQTRHTGGRDLRLSGELNLTIGHYTAECYSSLPSNANYQLHIKQQTEGPVFELHALIRNGYRGAGSYTMGSIMGDQASGVFQFGDKNYTTSGNEQGRITVDSDLRSGAIDQTFGAVRITGAWACTDFHKF